MRDFILAAAALMTAACATPPAPFPTLAGTSWTLRSIDGVTPAATRAPTLQFGSGGQASGEAGCNVYTGAYTQDGDRITFSAVAATLRACVDPAVNDQERRYLAALQKPQTAALANGELTLTSSAGSMLFVRPAAGPTVSFACDTGEQITVAFAEGSAHLIFPGGEDNLVQGPSGSGFSYIGPRNSLRGKGDEVIWSRARMAPKTCHKI